MTTNNKVTSTQLKELLAIKHSKDVFVTECKNGPTHIAKQLRIMDAWVMTKSWTNQNSIAYEIKVSRSDFLSDDKWHDYLSYCNEFYFVCPYGMIKPDELPDGVGLYWSSKHCKKLFLKKKANKRENVSIPEDLYRYILMARTTITQPNYYDHHDNKKYWENWLKNKTLDWEFGNHVSTKIKEYVKVHVEQVREESDRIYNENIVLSDVKDRIHELGFKTNMPIDKWKVFNKLDDIKRGVPRDLGPKINNMLINLEYIKEKLIK